MAEKIDGNDRGLQNRNFKLRETTNFLFRKNVLAYYHFCFTKMDKYTVDYITDHVTLEIRF
jgi:hypothetical protein